MTELNNDTLRIVLSLLSEPQRLAPRLVCKQWNESVMVLCEKDHIHDLIYNWKYISALKLILGPRKERLGKPLHPEKVLKAACWKAHYGMISLVFKLFPMVKVKDSFKELLNDRRNISVGLATLLFLQRGYEPPSDCVIDLEFAATCNCIELAEYVIAKKGTKVAKFNPFADTVVHAATNNNMEMAKLIVSTFDKDAECQFYTFKTILSNSVDIAVMCAPFLTESACAGVYDWLTTAEEKEDEKKEKILPLISERALRKKEADLKERLQNEAYDEILEIVQVNIVRTLRKKYGVEPAIKFTISREDVKKIDWEKPWGYSFSTNLPNLMALDAIFGPNNDDMSKILPDAIRDHIKETQCVITVNKVYNTEKPLPPGGTTSDCMVM